jgi:hypothetical protein
MDDKFLNFENQPFWWFLKADYVSEMKKKVSFFSKGNTFFVYPSSSLVLL